MTLLEEVHDSRRINRACEIASELVQHVTSLRLKAVHALGWTVVAVESGAHFEQEDATRIADAAQTAGSSEIVAIPTEALAGRPAGYRMKPTSEALLEFSRRCGHFNYLLLGTDCRFAVLCTVDDYFLVAGPEQFVSVAVGGDIDAAREDFRAFAGDPEWEEGQRATLIAVASQYDVDI